MAEFAALFSVRPAALALWARIGFLALVAALITTAGGEAALWWWFGAIVAVAVPALLQLDLGRWVARVTYVAEIVVTALGAALVTSADGTLTPYVAAPVFAAGIYAGFGGAMALAGLAAVLLVGVGAANSVLDHDAYQMQTVEWLMVAVVGAVLGSRIRSLAATRASQAEPDYAQATRLLTQLRTIARQLPGTLDPGGIAERLIDELRTRLPSDRAAVFTASGGGRLEVLAQRASRGADRVAWETSIDADTPIADAWATQQSQIATRSLVRATGGSPASVLVLPLVTGVRTVGIVALESDQTQAYDSESVEQATPIAAAMALRLETALLFDDVRSLATTEERQRLAREIHDGVAQELVMVGYGIDNAIAGLEPDTGVTESLHALRAEVTRVITELRLSLFELRSDVERHGGLGTAIAEYARAVGSSAGLRVHLSLDESTARLPAAIEAELLRIAQEAITNARKHSGADNLWVSCEIDPPNARIVVTDDGGGFGGGDPERDGARSSYGLSIMAERAERIRAILAINPREPNGTTVSVVLGGTPGATAR